MAAREALLREGESSLSRAKEEILLREASLSEREAILEVRESAAAQTTSGLEARERAVVAAEESLQQRQLQFAEAVAAASAPPLTIPVIAETQAAAANPSSSAFEARARVSEPEQVPVIPKELVQLDHKMPDLKGEEDDRQCGSTAEPSAQAVPKTESVKAGVAVVKQELHRSKVRYCLSIADLLSLSE